MTTLIMMESCNVCALVASEASGARSSTMLSFNRRLRLWLLGLFLIVYPFLNIFGQLDHINPAFEDISLLRIYNFAAVVLVGLIFIMFRKRFLPNVYRVAGLLLGMLFVNYVLTDLASDKWLLNWIGFVFISAVVVKSIASLSQCEILMLQRLLVRMLRPIIVVFSVLVATIFLLNIEVLRNNFFIDHDNIIYSLTTNAGIEKQALGTFIGFVAILAACFWKTSSKATRFLLLVFFVITIPAVLGIRTLILGVGLVAVWYWLAMRTSRKVIFFAFCSTLLMPGFLYYSELIVLVEELYDRFSSLQFALSTLFSNPFGLGNGGYHLFIEANNDAVLALFGSEKMAKAGLFWTAPESDLVYFIASWGVLSVFFFIFFAYLLLLGGKLLRSHKCLFPIERALILMAWLLIFMGISQDNAGALIWWIFMAGGYGVILRHKRMRTTHNSMSKYSIANGLDRG